MRAHYHVGRYDTVIEAIRIIGDVINFVVTSALMMRLGVPLWCVSLAVSAEFIRLLAEKGQMIISAVWQQLPHRLVAHFMATHAPSWRWLHRYCTYYILDDEGRLEYVLRTLKHNAQNDSEFAHKLAYVNEFQVVSHDIGLRAGAVRDVAGGAIFIHRAWTNDPWLLMGQAIRRSPWMFDPRYLTRPFYYRTHSNRLATLLVLRHARHCPPYALYQFGHEIKAARYDLFYRLVRRLGLDVEGKVGADGTAQFDSLLHWIGVLVGRVQESNPRRELWADDEALTDIACRIRAGEMLTPQIIAADYTYPMKYVDEVLWAKVSPLL